MGDVRRSASPPSRMTILAGPGCLRWTARPPPTPHNDPAASWCRCRFPKQHPKAPAPNPQSHSPIVAVSAACAGAPSRRRRAGVELLPASAALPDRGTSARQALPISTPLRQPASHSLASQGHCGTQLLSHRLGHAAYCHGQASGAGRPNRHSSDGRAQQPRPCEPPLRQPRTVRRVAASNSRARLHWARAPPSAGAPPAASAAGARSTGGVGTPASSAAVRRRPGGLPHLAHRAHPNRTCK